MPKQEKSDGGELFIVDNSAMDWKVVDYLSEWTDIAKSFDIATGYFEIGALLALDGKWQQLENLRILMGDEVSKRTKKALLDGNFSQVSRLSSRLLEISKFFAVYITKINSMPKHISLMQNILL